MSSYPNELDIIFDKLNKSNIKPIIVGGYIRDKLLKINSKDIDIELYNISSLGKVEKILQEFGSVNNVGKSFGVCKLSYQGLDLDFSLPREDSKISSGHKGFKIITNKNLDFKTATSRRDFKMNAIGYDVINQKILDPFNGQKDIKNKIISAVNIEKFADDPLRVLRAVQFSSRFNFLLDDELFKKCKTMIKDTCLNELAKERVFDELKKLLLKSPKPSVGFLLLKKLGAFSYFKELSTLKDNELKHIFLSLDIFHIYKTKNDKNSITIALSLLCYYFCNNDIEKFLYRLSIEKELIKHTVAILENKNIINLNNITNYSIYILATKTDIELFSIFLKSIYLDKKNTQIDKLLTKATKLGVLHKKVDPILRGKDIISLGIRPSPKFSKVLSSAYDAQIRGRFSNHKTAIAWLKIELSHF